MPDRLPGPPEREWWVYVIQSLEKRYGRRGRPLPGFHYVGCTTDVLRRLRQHNGEIVGGGKYTSKHRPWELRAVYGPYADQSEALKAERALKHGKRGTARLAWSPSDSKWCRGLGTAHPLVTGASE
jgi:predicted GIY-YIG superfamily endonuclease